MGGVVGLDYAALPVILQCRHVPPSEWGFMLEKIHAVAQVAVKHWNAKDG